MSAAALANNMGEAARKGGRSGGGGRSNKMGKGGRDFYRTVGALVEFGQM